MDARTGRYHHGDLRTALVVTALELIAERGIAALSVAETARRVGVSAAAPYRHFPTRQALLAATAVRAAELLLTEIQSGLDADPSDDPVEALALLSAGYTRFVVRHGVGHDLIFALELRGIGSEELSTAGRAVTDLMFSIARSVTGDAETALELLEQCIAAAHGYAVLLHRSGFGNRHAADVEHSANAVAGIARTLGTALS